MKRASGSSFPIVNALTSHALWRMPRTFTQVSAAVTPRSSSVRGQPAVTACQ